MMAMFTSKFEMLDYYKNAAIVIAGLVLIGVFSRK
jgi:hypothetical protein